jgi:hypothetical protein
MVNTTPEIMKREMSERWVPSISQRVRAAKVKGVVKVRRKSRKNVSHWIEVGPQPSISPKEKFQEFGEWSDQWLGSLHFKLPVTEILIQPGPLDRGRLIAVDLV